MDASTQIVRRISLLVGAEEQQTGVAAQDAAEENAIQLHALVLLLLRTHGDLSGETTTSTTLTHLKGVLQFVGQLIVPKFISHLRLQDYALKFDRVCAAMTRWSTEMDRDVVGVAETMWGVEGSLPWLLRWACVNVPVSMAQEWTGTPEMHKECAGIFFELLKNFRREEAQCQVLMDLLLADFPRLMLDLLLVSSPSADEKILLFPGILAHLEMETDKNDAQNQRALQNLKLYMRVDRDSLRESAPNILWLLVEMLLDEDMLAESLLPTLDSWLKLTCHAILQDSLDPAFGLGLLQKFSDNVPGASWLLSSQSAALFKKVCAMLDNLQLSDLSLRMKHCRQSLGKRFPEVRVTETSIPRFRSHAEPLPRKRSLEDDLSLKDAACKRQKQSAFSGVPETLARDLFQDPSYNPEEISLVQITSYVQSRSISTMDMSTVAKCVLLISQHLFPGMVQSSLDQPSAIYKIVKLANWKPTCARNPDAIPHQIDCSVLDAIIALCSDNRIDWGFPWMAQLFRQMLLRTDLDAANCKLVAYLPAFLLKCNQENREVLFSCLATHVMEGSARMRKTIAVHFSGIICSMADCPGTGDHSKRKLAVRDQFDPFAQLIRSRDPSDEVVTGVIRGIHRLCQHTSTIAYLDLTVSDSNRLLPSECLAVFQHDYIFAKSEATSCLAYLISKEHPDVIYQRNWPHLIQQIQTLTVVNGGRRDGGFALDLVDMVGRCSRAEIDAEFQVALVSELLNWYFDRHSQIQIAAAEQLSQLVGKISKTAEASLLVFLLKQEGKHSTFLELSCERLFGRLPKDVLRRNIPRIFPRLVFERDRESVQRIAEIMGKPLKSFAMEYSQYVLALASNYADDSLSHGASGFICELLSSPGETMLTQNDLFGMFRQALTGVLCYGLGSAREEDRTEARRILDYVARLLAPINNANLSRKRKQPCKLVGLILGNSLAIMHGFTNQRLMDPEAELDEKKQLLRALVEMIKILNVYAGEIVTLLIRLLRQAQKELELVEDALQVWSQLVHVLETEDISRHFSVIVVSLLECFHEDEDVPRDVLEMLEFLIIGHERDFCRQFDEIFFLPNLPLLSKVKVTVEKHIEVRRRNFKEGIKMMLRGLKHDMGAVVYLSAKHLYAYLGERESELFAWIGNTPIDEMVRKTIQEILEACRRFALDDTTDIEQSREICRHLGMCLGKIGAIDPDYLTVKMTSSERRALEFGKLKLVDDFSNLEQVAPYICRFMEEVLLRSLRATSNPRHQSRYSLVFQKLLEECKFTPKHDHEDDNSDNKENRATVDPENSRIPVVAQLWKGFSESTRRALQPYLTSHYYCKLAPPAPFLQAPILSNVGCHQEWIQKWLVQMIQQLNDESAKSLFTQCIPILRGMCADFQAASWLLPQLVLCTLLRGTDQQRFYIAIEFLAVIQDLNSDQLSMQTIFQLMDELHRWIKLKTETMRKEKRARLEAGKKPTSTLTIEKPSSNTLSIDEVCAPVYQLLAKIPQKSLASAALKCQAYARAVMHFELHIRELLLHSAVGELQSEFEQLLSIYVNVDEADGLDGISSALRKNGAAVSIDRQILEHKSAGRWENAQACYETQMQLNREDLKAHLGFLECLESLGHYESMLTHIQGITEMASDETDNKLLHALGVSASWHLSKWDSLDEFLSKPLRSDNFGVGLGRILNAARKKDRIAFQQHVDHARDLLMLPIAAASSESYHRCYFGMQQLHMLEEIQAFSTFLLGGGHDAATYDSLIERLQKRLVRVAPGIRYRQPIYELRRVLLNEVKNLPALESIGDACRRESGNVELHIVKCARRAGFHSTAYGALLRAEILDAQFLTVQRAKLLYSSGSVEHAIDDVRSALEALKQTPALVSAITNGKANGDKSSFSSEEILMVKLSVMLGRWLMESDTYRGDEVVKIYRQATAVLPKSEKAWYFFGKFCNRNLEDAQAYFHSMSQSNADKTEKRALEKERAQSYGSMTDLMIMVLSCFSHALESGVQYMFQTLPRFLTVWLDYTTFMPEDTSPNENGIGLLRSKTSLAAAQKYANSVCEKVPSFALLSAFSQLISRICHNNEATLLILDKMITRVLKAYPQQCLWMMAAVAASTHDQRAKRCRSILEAAQEYPAKPGRKGDETAQAAWEQEKRTADLIIDLYKESAVLTKHLVELCDYQIVQKGAVALTMSKDFAKLKRMVPLKLIVPIQSSLNVTMPEKSSTMHVPVAVNLPTIRSFVDQIEVMNSLQRPRKIGIVGSDGNIYHFLCKPKDDMRKDCRVLEFYNLINKLLQNSPEARKRRLNIRTYAVVPLNEECGVIEWVPDTTTFRTVLARQYAKKKVPALSLPKMKQWREIAANPSNALQEFFRDNMLTPHQPAVLNNWFLETFTDPASWLAARLGWARTVAVMSMVGFIVGLGDRHAENILVDTSTGDAVHVDFNCLFEKGITFDHPERVPFRLTHNIIDAFGVTGTHGVFQRCCEVALRVMRENKDALMSSLETFLHDPLVEWSGRSAKSLTSSTQRLETSAEFGRKVLKNISNKLEGGMGLIYQFNNVVATKGCKSTHAKSLVLAANGVGMNGLHAPTRARSVEGQVYELIQQATDPEHLSRMWIGWASYY